MTKRGWNTVDHLSIETRIEMQEQLLKAWRESVEMAPRPCIVDRTPLDFAAYTLAEVGMHATDQDLGLRIFNYVEDCITLTTLLFDTVFVCDPLEVYEEDPKSPPPNLAYQRHIHSLVHGLAHETECSVGSVRPMSVEERGQAVGEFIVKRLEAIREELKESVYLH